MGSPNWSPDIIHFEQLDKRDQNLIYLRLVLVALFWSGTVIGMRVASQTFEPFWGAFLRYVVACIGFLPVVIPKGLAFFKMSLKQWFQVILLGFTGVFAYNYLCFKVLKTMQANHVALIIALNPILVMMGSAWMHKDRITRRRLLGALVSLLGVAIVISRGRLWQIFSGYELGDLLTLLATFCWMMYTLFARNTLETMGPLQASFWASVTGMIMLGLMAMTEPLPSRVPASAIFAVVYLGLIGTVVGFIWYYDGIKKLGATRAAMFNNLIPVFTLVLSVIILNEEVSTYTYIGAALVTGGVLLANRMPRRNI
jgi:drug/metabolite transporter (DMT)-like permease